MQFLKRLRGESLRKVMIGAVIFFAAAAAVFFIFDGPAAFGSLFPKRLDQLDPDQMEGAYVQDEIYFLYGQYAEEEETRNGRRTGKITGAQYLTDLDDVYYMGIFGHEKDLDTLSHMMEACRDYVNGRIPADQVPVVPVQGTIRAMDSQLQEYYYDMAQGDRELEALMAPYYLDMGYIGGQKAWVAWVMVAVAAALLALALVPVMLAASGGYQKKLLKKVDSMGDREAVLEQLEGFYETTPPVCGVRMSREFVLLQNGSTTVLLRPWDLAWAYQSTTQHRTNGLPTGKTYAAILRTMDGQTYTLGMKEEQVQRLLEAIRENLPGTVVGYTPDLENLYMKKRQVFLDHWEEVWPGCTGRTQAGTATIQ